MKFEPDWKRVALNALTFLADYREKCSCRGDQYGAPPICDLCRRSGDFFRAAMNSISLAEPPSKSYVMPQSKAVEMSESLKAEIEELEKWARERWVVASAARRNMWENDEIISRAEQVSTKSQTTQHHATAGDRRLHVYRDGKYILVDPCKTYDTDWVTPPALKSSEVNSPHPEQVLLSEQMEKALKCEPSQVCAEPQTKAAESPEQPTEAEWTALADLKQEQKVAWWEWLNMTPESRERFLSQTAAGALKVLT